MDIAVTLLWVLAVYVVIAYGLVAFYLFVVIGLSTGQPYDVDVYARLRNYVPLAPYNVVRSVFWSGPKALYRKQQVLARAKTRQESKS